MSTIDERVAQPISGPATILRGSAAAPAVGFGVYLIAVVLGLALDAGKPAQQGFTEWAVTLVIALAAVALATWLAAWAQRRGSQARTALGLGVVAILSIVVFWAGLPCVFGGTAVSMGRVAGSRGAALVGIVLGALGLVAGAYVMVVG